MPEDFYRVGPAEKRQFDDVGLRALQRDWAAWSEEPSDDLMRRSQFNLFHDIGVHLFGRNSKQAFEYAMYFMERRKRTAPVLKAANPQRLFL
jgi:hypothetical protein